MDYVSRELIRLKTEGKIEAARAIARKALERARVSYQTKAENERTTEEDICEEYFSVSPEKWDIGACGAAFEAAVNVMDFPVDYTNPAQEFFRQVRELRAL